MANTQSAKKRIRSSERKRQRNLIHRGRARTGVRKARQMLQSGSLEEATSAVREAAKQLDHAASKGSIHKKNAARRKGRLMKHLAKRQATES